MAGIKHEHQTAIPDDGSDVNGTEWNKAHTIVAYYDVTPDAAEPATPAAGKVREFWVDSGVSPNRRIFRGLKLDDGTVLTLFDITI